MKLKKIALMITSTMFATSAVAAPVKQERWFEVEVVFFTQLGDKDKLQEVFPEKDQLPAMPRYKKVIDLITPFLHPDISVIRQKLPICDSSVTSSDFSAQQYFSTKPKLLPPYFSTLTLEEIEALPLVDEFGQNLFQFESDSSELTEDAFNEETQPSDEFSDDESAFIEPTEEITELNELGTNESSIELPNDLADDEFFISTITPEQQQLVVDAENYFTPALYSTIPLIAKPVENSTSIKVCTFVEQDFNEVKKLNPEFEFNGLEVTKVPLTIKGNEDEMSEKPYLIHQDSLQLHDIVKQLRRSKGFRPLLHLGWRHAPQTKRIAEAYRIYGGNNHKASYDVELEEYNILLEEAKLAEAAALESTTEDLTEQPEYAEQGVYDNSALELTPEQEVNLAIQSRIQEVIEQVNDISSSDLPTIQTSLDNPDDNLDFLPSNVPLNLANPPESPVQDWYLDGLFRVHLDHYLYITADFNLVNKTLAEQVTHKLNSIAPMNLKPIRFQQNRRVISGEIHYFDHPYMGMIVQIRKYKRPEPDQDKKETIN